MPIKDSSFKTRQDFLTKVVVPMVVQRRRLKLTQGDLDYKLGVADGLVSHWECGRRSPTAFNLFCWAEALNGEIIFRPYQSADDLKMVVKKSCNDNNRQIAYTSHHNTDDSDDDT